MTATAATAGEGLGDGDLVVVSDIVGVGEGEVVAERDGLLVLDVVADEISDCDEIGDTDKIGELDTREDIDAAGDAVAPKDEVAVDNGDTLRTPDHVAAAVRELNDDAKADELSVG